MPFSVKEEKFDILLCALVIRLWFSRGVSGGTSGKAPLLRSVGRILTQKVGVVSSMCDPKNDDPVVSEDRCRQLLVSLRKIIQAIDLHSRNLSKTFGLTGPQLIILQEIGASGRISVKPLAERASLSQATVTDITKRLEQRGYLIKTKRTDDKRSVTLTLSDKGIEMLKKVPPLLQELFTDRFNRLEGWEQMMIISSFERVVSMMQADQIEAAPIMATGPITVSEGEA